MTLTHKTWLRRGLALGLGAAVGFAYHHFVGCSSGGCPIWTNAWVSTGVGALFGTLLVW
jgi:hypothetical protein